MASAGTKFSAVRRTPSPHFVQQRQSGLSTQSMVSSSAASFQTAPTSSPASSSHTLNAANPNSGAVNPLYTVAGSQEIHIVKVTTDSVHVEAGPVPDSFFDKVGKSVAQVVQTNGDAHIGPPPPSPPASIIRHIGEDDPPSSLPPAEASSSRFEPFPPPTSPSHHQAESVSRPVMFVEPEPIRERQASNSSRLTSRTIDSLHRSSTDTKGTLPTTRTLHTSPMAESSTMRSKAAGHLSADGYLQPLVMQRPTRRNTTGTYIPNIKATSTQPFAMDDTLTGEGGIELASDIELHAEQIRRERISKRAKQQQEAEAAMTRSDVKDMPLVGNLIGEDHVNYVLMYNMLTGIRIGVSRCQAKIKRPLTADDFTARHKFSFDIVGNELTPSAKYDFKFKDYAPWVFRTLREDQFNLDPADYLLSLTAKYILSELGSPGKSGSFFYFSRDYRFIIKTIRHSEHKFLLSILEDYYKHVQANPHTLLSRFYGLHRVKLPRGRKIHFVIMNNLFPPHRDIHETFDLKGSTVGREYPEEKAAANPRAVLKDLNWINRNKMLEFGPEKRALLTEQLRRDAEFLKKIHVMDYSLLVGIHNMQRGNRDNVRKNTLKVFSPNIPMTRKMSQAKSGSKSPEAIAIRHAMRSSDPKRLGKGTIRLPETDTGDRQGFVFYQDEGGLRATDETNEPQDTIYYLGVIDILTPWSFVKRVEGVWKGLKADRHKISPVPPTEYSDRFFNFMKAIMRGGEGGERFKSE